MQSTQSSSLRYFAAVAQYGSIRDAAEALHVAQSAISRQIMKIEEQYGVPLLERHPRGVRLTIAGDIYLRYARDNLAQVERMRADFESLKGLRRGTVRVHAIEVLAHDFLPRAIGRFTQRYPGLTFEVVVEGSDHVVEAVRELRTDLGFAFYVQVDRDIDTLFRVREPVVAVMAARHPLASAERLSLVDFVDYPVAVPPKRSGSRMLIDAACKAANVDLVPALEANSLQLMARFVQQTQAITFLSRLSIIDGLRNGDLVAIPLRDPLMNSATIDALTLASRKLPLAVEEFQRFLHAELQKLRHVSGAGRGSRHRRAPPAQLVR
jgi:DNA-binding transcriptional LysR family regulator